MIDINDAAYFFAKAFASFNSATPAREHVLT